jgi:NAD(P)-dependent dehydrogenase (short-subunit alcohol dehydrogenase family)
LALIAGGAGGVGQAVAAAVARRGGRAILMGRTETRLRDAAAALGDCPYVVADLTDREAVEAAWAEVVEQQGVPDLVVNAAGIAESAPLLPPDDALWERTLQINATGGWILSTVCLPAMIERGSGCLVHIASTAALQGYRYTAAYVASKHALLGLCRALAEDVGGKGVRVACLCPGFLDTPMTARTIDNMVATTGMDEAAARGVLAKMNASGALITPEQVADATLAFLDDPASGGAVRRLD